MIWSILLTKAIPYTAQVMSWQRTHDVFKTHTPIYNTYRKIDFKNTPHSTLSFMCTCHMWWIDIHISCIYNTYTYLQHTSYDRFWIHTPFNTLVCVYMAHVMNRYTHTMYLQHTHIYNTHLTIALEYTPHSTPSCMCVRHIS